MRSPPDKDFCFESKNSIRQVISERWSSPDGHLSQRTA